MSEVQYYDGYGNALDETDPVIARKFVAADDYDAHAAKCERLRDTLSAAQRVTVAVIDERDAALAELAGLSEQARGKEIDYYRLQSEAQNLRAELAALKGGQVPTGFQRATILKDCNVRYSADTAPPAQASAWVPEDLRARCAEILNWQKTGVLTGDCLRQYAAKSHYAGDHNELRIAEAETAREAFALLAAPTPGASDGKESP